MAQEHIKSVVLEMHMLPCAPSSDLFASFNLVGWSVPLIPICHDFVLVVIILEYKLVVTCAQFLPFGTQGTYWCFDIIFWPQIWVLIWTLFRFAPIQCFLFKFHYLCNAHSYCDTNYRCFVNRTSKLIWLLRCSRKMMVASNRHEDLYLFRPKPFV